MPQGFLLHSRVYRETSVIASFFTDSDGRLDVIVRSARKPAKGGSHKPLPFCRYDMTWSGKNDLKQLQTAESLHPPMVLEGQLLYCGFYINELMYRLLPHHQAEPEVFALYADALERLPNCEEIEPLLREFEMGLLSALGYGIGLHDDADGKALVAEQMYVFVADKGLIKSADVSVNHALAGRGAVFMAMARNDYSSAETKKIAKRLLRQVLARYLGKQPLRSRDFFV